MSNDDRNLPPNEANEAEALPITDVTRSDVSAPEAEKVKGGAGTFELKDFSFGVANPTTIGSSDTSK